MLGLALGAGALVDGLGASRRRLRGRWLRPFAAAGARRCWHCVNLPSLTGHRLVDPALDRDQDPPAAWLEAAAALDAAPAGYRVLQLPGAEFGAFRWGYTVDPPLPGADRPPARHARPPAARQPGGDGPAVRPRRPLPGRHVEPAAIAPVARLLGADTIWVTGDAAFERFRTPRPELVHDLFAGAPRPRSAPVRTATPCANVPIIPMVDEQSAVRRRIGQPIPPVELVPVDDPVGVIRVKDRRGARRRQR